MTKTKSGFTIVELLIVIVVIAILAAISVVAYNGIQTRAKNAQRDHDLTQLEKAIRLARINTGKQTVQITLASPAMTSFNCSRPTGANSSLAVPNTLPQSHQCWVDWRSTLDNLSVASGMDLSGLKNGDASGNPYYFNENDGEGNGGNFCLQDDLGYFTGTDTNFAITKQVKSSRGDSCSSL